MMKAHRTRSRLAAALCLALAASALAGPASAQSAQEPRPETRRLTIVGEGEVRAAPDMALLTIGVVSEAATAAEALAANNRDMTEVIEAIKGSGVAPADIQTSGFSVNPKYDVPPQPVDGRPIEPKIVGYTVSNNVVVRIRDLQNAGPLLDKVVGLGSNAISGLAFDVAERKPLEDRAREAAVADATARAKLLAQAAGVTLGPILSIEEREPGYPGPVMARMEMAQAADMSVPIEAGELSFRSNVAVVWQIAD